MPGILTGTIIGLAQALGETAPLLLIGMNAFITAAPEGMLVALDRPADADLHLVRQPRARLRRAHQRRDHRAARLPDPDERGWPSSSAGGSNANGDASTRHRCAAAIQSSARALRHGTAAANGRPPSDGSPAAIAGTPDHARSRRCPSPRCRPANVNLWYGEKQALFDVSLDIAEHEVTALIGPSGCGKSTFLRCLNRMNDVIDICRVEGDIRLDGEDIYDRSIDVVQLRARVGMVFQKPNPFPKSIYDNVAYGPRIHGLARSKSELDEIVETQPARAPACGRRCKDRLAQPGTGLSGGQQQRLCIARAIAVSPEVILMDEPCSALDPIATAHIEELIDELREKFTIAIVTHNMQQAARVSQRTAFFHLGKLIEYGDTDQIFTNPNADR